MPKYKRVSLFARIHACMHTYITHKHTYTRLASMCNDDVHATMHARAAHSLSRASTHAAPKRCYRYRAPGCRARSFHRQRAALAHTHTHIHTYTLTHTLTHMYACVCKYSRIGASGPGIFPRPAQILLRAGINLLPPFRSRSQTFRAYEGKCTFEGGRRSRRRQGERGEEEVDLRVDPGRSFEGYIRRPV